MNVRYHVIADLKINKAGLSDEEIARDPVLQRQIRTKRYSITSLCMHPGRGSVYCGVTNTGGNILLEFRPKTGKFVSLGYAKLAEPCEVKIHRGLWLDEPANALYFGTATLSEIPQLVKAPGGRLVRYDIDQRRFETLGIPIQGNYIQATNVDARRGLMYSFSIWDFCFAVWSLKRRKVVRVHPMASIVHVSAIDDDGGVWGTYSMYKQAFFRYDPDRDELQFPEGCALPTALAASNLMYRGAGPVDGMINGGDGFMYVGSAMGELYRLDPRTHEIVYLGRPMPANRLPALQVGADGLIYGVGGDANATTLFRYDRGRGSFELLGKVLAPDGTACYRPHDLVVVGNTAYVGETDNPKRSGYLWECRF